MIFSAVIYIYNYINFTYIKLKLERLIRKSFLSGCKMTLLLYLVNSTFYRAFRLGFPGFQFLYRVLVSRSYTYFKIYSSSVLIVKWERRNTRTTEPRTHDVLLYLFPCTVVYARAYARDAATLSMYTLILYSRTSSSLVLYNMRSRTLTYTIRYALLLDFKISFKLPLR